MKAVKVIEVSAADFATGKIRFDAAGVGNIVVHVNAGHVEGVSRPDNKPISVAVLQEIFDAADDFVALVRSYYQLFQSFEQSISEE